MADLGFRIYVTKGELATIMGPLAYGSAKRQLRSGTSPLGTTGLDIIEILDENTGIYLDNPEVTAMLDALASAGIITAAVRQKVAIYVTSQALVVPMPVNLNLKKYALPTPDGVHSIADYAAFVSGWCTFNTTSTGLLIDKVGVFQIDGVCTNPAATEVL